MDVIIDVYKTKTIIRKYFLNSSLCVTPERELAYVLSIAFRNGDLKFIKPCGQTEG